MSVIQLSGDAFQWPFTSMQSKTPLPTPSQLPPVDHSYPSSTRKLPTLLTIMALTHTRIHRESWLDRHHKKQRRSKCIGWLIVLFTIIVIVAIVFVVLWLLKMGIFHR
jgi:hypothetical protein